MKNTVGFESKYKLSIHENAFLKWRKWRVHNIGLFIQVFTETNNTMI